MRQTEAYAIARFLVRRVAAGVLVLFVVSVLMFALVSVLPGNAATLRGVGALFQGSSPAEIAKISHQYGLDKPATERYWEWLSGLLHGNLGTSLGAGNEPVSAIIKSRIGNTVTLGLSALAVAIPLALLLGIIAGTREGRRLDQTVSASCLALVAIPEFVLAAVLIVIFAFWLGLLPPISLLPGGQAPITHPTVLVLPVMTLALGVAAFGARFVRASVAEVSRSRYVEMARLNGIPERRVILRHILPNALAPSVQVLAALTGLLVGGSVLVETIFAYPGLGAMLASSVQSEDVPVVLGIGMLVATVIVVAYILADLALVLLIPKLRTSL